MKQGEERKADFFDVVAWRATAEFVCKYFLKGSLIAVDGQLQSRNYEKDGQNRTAIEVVANQVSFTGKRKDQNAYQSQEPVVTTPPRDQRAYQGQYQQQYQPQQTYGAQYDPRYQQGMISDRPPAYTPD